MSSDYSRAEKRILDYYATNGVVSEDFILDVCLEYDLDFAEIDSLCGKILTQKVLIQQIPDLESPSEDAISDFGHINYDELLTEIQRIEPSLGVFISEIKKIVPPQNREWIQLLPQAKSGSEYARERLVYMYLRSVIRIAFSFAENNYVDLQESIQDAAIGILNAINKYDVTSSDPFGTYYPLWCIQEMQRSCMFRHNLCRFPVHVKERIFPYLEVIKNNDFFDNYKIAIDYADCELRESIGKKELSMSYFLTWQGIPDCAVDENEVYSDVFMNDLKNGLFGIMAGLSDREKQIILLRYGFYEDTCYTLEEVGMRFGITRERVRQIESKALKKMRLQTLKLRLDEYI